MIIDVDKPRACGLNGGAGPGAYPPNTPPAAGHTIVSLASPASPGPGPPFCLYFFPIVSTRESTTTSSPLGCWPFLILYELKPGQEKDDHNRHVHIA